MLSGLKNAGESDTLKNAGYEGVSAVCGSAYRIGEKRRRNHFCGPVKKVGILLCSEEIHNTNLYMLRFFKEYSVRVAGIAYYLKFHPSSRKDLYDDTLLSFASEVHWTDITAVEFIDRIDLGIVSYSSTLMDLLNAMVPVLVMPDENGAGTQIRGFEEISFHTEKELSCMMSKINDGTMESYYMDKVDHFGNLEPAGQLYADNLSRLGLL